MQNMLKCQIWNMMQTSPRNTNIEEELEEGTGGSEGEKNEKIIIDTDSVKK